eukprot:5804779-Prymnesium_polylepis.1
MSRCRRKRQTKYAARKCSLRNHVSGKSQPCIANFTIGDCAKRARSVELEDRARRRPRSGSAARYCVL